MSSITENNGVIYLLTSPSGKQYVGQTWDYERRMRDYRYKSCKEQAVIYAAIRKYGWDNFAVAILACGIQTQATLDATESAFIAMLKTMSPQGYNLRAGGGRGKHHVLTKEKIGEKHRGKIVSKETRDKLSVAHTGKPKSEKHRAKMSAAKRGEKNHNFGKPAWNRGKPHSKETRKK